MFQLVFVHRVPTSTTTATGRKFPNLGELKLSKNYFIICLKFSSLRMRREFVFESGVGRLAAQLMQSAYSVFYHEHVLNKEPGHLSFSLSFRLSISFFYFMCLPSIPPSSRIYSTLNISMTSKEMHSSKPSLL